MTERVTAARWPGRDRWGALTVGIVGHRWNRLDRSMAPTLRQRFSELFRDIEAAARIAGKPPGFTMLCGLAEGADRIAAEALPEGWGLDAIVLEPAAAMLAQETPDEAEALRRLLAAPRCRLLAMPGAAADDYAAQADLILARSDLLVAAWDGGASAGCGGTRHSIERALGRGLPVIWLTTVEREAPPRLLRRLLKTDTPATELLTPALLVSLTTDGHHSGGG